MIKWEFIQMSCILIQFTVNLFCFVNTNGGNDTRTGELDFYWVVNGWSVFIQHAFVNLDEGETGLSIIDVGSRCVDFCILKIQSNYL